MCPSFDRDPILERNNARQLFARAGWKSHFRSIVEPQAIDVSLAVLVNGGDDAGYGQGLLGFPPWLSLFSRRGRTVIIGDGRFLLRLGRSA